MLAKTPTIGIVLLSFNRFSITEKCIKSLYSINYPRFSIVVVDNNSADNSGEKLKENFPEITLLKSKINRGFCGGNNLGIRHCLAAKFDYIMVLNDDIEVESGLSIHTGPKKEYQYQKTCMSSPEKFTVIMIEPWSGMPVGIYPLFMGSESTGAISRRTGRNITLIARSNTPAAADACQE